MTLSTVGQGGGAEREQACHGNIHFSKIFHCTNAAHTHKKKTKQNKQCSFCFLFTDNFSFSTNISS